MPNLTASSASLTVAENSLATAIGIVAPTDVSFASSALTVTVTGLPSDGTLLLSDGVTPVSVGATLTVAQLIGLKFRPTLNSFGASSSFAFTVSDPAGNTASATATLAIGPSTTPVVTGWSSLTVPQRDGATSISIQAPSDANFASSQLTVKVTGLPTNGTVLLSDGTTPVTVGETLTVAQLTGLEFAPTALGSGFTVSDLTYSVSDPAGKSSSGTAMLEVGPDTPPTTSTQLLTVAENSGATPIGIQSPTDASFAPSALSVSVTGLPTDGTVVLSNGITPVSTGQSLTVAQLTGLEFVPTSGVFAQSSNFTYGVSDPTGATTSGSATLRIGPSNTPLVTTPTSLTVAENSGVTPIGIVAPNDASFAASALNVTVTGLPTDGTVLLANGTSPVTVGESLTVAQLTGLMFKPTQDSTGQSSTFTYSVSDPAAHSTNGSVTLATGPNAIVLENEKPGTPESVWQVAPGADSMTIQGFTTSMSTNVGGTVDFKINNQTGNANYQINIYRLGYYGGDGATLVTSINHQSGTIVQPAALVDPTTGLVDAGNWQVTDAWAIPANATSGIYVANVVDGSQVFQIPFIVRNDGSHSDIVYQTSDQTWQAYNGWGGSNLYGGNGPGFGGSAYAVSYNRPIVTQDGIGTDANVYSSLMGTEYPAIQWMEQNGYDVSYISGVDTATNGALLLNHKIFMDAGHDEYWTTAQRANVQAAADAGVNLTFLSGNEIFWKTRFEPSIDGSASANRTLVSYKDTHANALIDPTGTATDNFSDPRFGPALPANELTGTVMQVNAVRNDTITIPSSMTQLRFWRNSAIANTPAGQTASLTPGLLGIEWDSSPDNGFRPVSLVDLSSTTLQVTTQDQLDYGTTFGAGTATHNLVEYRDPTSGALVFGAGSIDWSWGLSADHTNFGTPSDPNVQQAMVNLFADMGVQPGTLQATLMLASQSTDHTPPTAAISAVSATTVVEGRSVTVTGTASDVGGLVAGVLVSSDGGATWHPASSPVGASVNWTYTFTAGAPGTYTIQSKAVDDSINLGTPGAGVSYTVSPSTALTLFSPGATPATADVNDTSSVEVGFKFQSATKGEITGIRFYKGPLNTGTHTGNLWSATGTLLATATFTNETASGWQQVNFSTPVNITPGTTYIASYHTNVGEYSDTPYFFDTIQGGPTNGSLSATGTSLNGVFTYASGNGFPTNIAPQGDNYWVDVVFNDGVNSPTANNVSGFVATENTALSIPASALLANDTDPNGLPLSLVGVSNPIDGTVTYNSSTQTVTFVPSTAGTASFTYSITDGLGGTASAGVSITVNNPATAQTLFATSDTPAIVTVSDHNAVELGVKFQALTSGTITGIRFYKGPQNTGTHVADLWTATGTLLATASFTNESASGWQQVNFASPVSITAGTTYVASYHTSVGNYSADLNYFATAHASGSLTALASSSSGGDGVYAYGAGDLFPTNTNNAANYWVDAVFEGPALQPPVANNDSGFAVLESTAVSIPASALLANDTDPNGLPLSISGVSNPSNGTVSYNSSTQTVSFVPTTGYTGPAGFTYTITDGQAGTASANVALTVTPLPPVANNDSGFVATINTTDSIPASALLANDTDPNGLPLSITGVSNPSNGTVTYNASTQTVSFVPTTGYTGTASFTYSITDGQGAASANVALLVNDPSVASLFTPTSTPSIVTVNDSNSVELGLKFDASVNGQITGMRFYKSPQNTGTHVADLWTATGSLLATATFTNETASGWQQVNFANPVPVTAGTTYVASYHTNGDYSADPNLFANALTNGPLTAPSNSTSGGNGVYAYGSSSLFPANSGNATSYGVDVLFKPQLAA